jgi:diguanylate cyclase (GGDEF)-like protein
MMVVLRFHSGSSMTEEKPKPASKVQTAPVVDDSKAKGSIRPGARVAGRGSHVDIDWMTEDTGNFRATEVALHVPQGLRERNRASVTVMNGLDAGRVFAIDQPEAIVGRARDAQIRIDAVGISRTHSRIVQSLDGGFVLEDLDSTNGTFLGGQRIKRSPLASGDTFQVGPNVVLKFALVDEAEQSLAQRLYESSTRDPLTRAFNRKYFDERVVSEVAYAARHKARLAIVLLDIDHFKAINDTYGHLAGDEVLRQFSALIAGLIRSEDVLARYGGEEFVLLIRGIEKTNVLSLAERIRRTIEVSLVTWEGKDIRVTTSLGVAALGDLTLDEGHPQPTPNPGQVERGVAAIAEALLAKADERLYAAKNSGRNQVRGD